MENDEISPSGQTLLRCLVGIQVERLKKLVGQRDLDFSGDV